MFHVLAVSQWSRTSSDVSPARYEVKWSLISDADAMVNFYLIRSATGPELQVMFNDGRYWEDAEAGVYQQVVRDDRHPALPLAMEPYCTRSQIVSYRDAQGTEIARVHQYRRIDGTIGLSGRPDPKKLLVNGIIYRYQRS
jgi:hypothetical protein